jgi:hypothetical protein
MEYPEPKSWIPYHYKNIALPNRLTQYAGPTAQGHQIRCVTTLADFTPQALHGQQEGPSLRSG